MSYRILWLSLFVIMAVEARAVDETDIEGRWLSGDGTGYINIRLVDGRPIGTAGLATDKRDPKLPITDIHNPDETLRTRSLLGITILQGFEYDGDGVWKGGTVYDPNSGKVYKSTLTLVDKSTLKVRGYVGFSWIGASDIWIRVGPPNSPAVPD
ncbi:MAG: DUF2147 domain-containing protein [Pseudomonadota bacterium]